jgi:AraC-like DNA-binding protein
VVAVAQLVESRIVIPAVVGSSPIGHPTLLISGRRSKATLATSRIGEESLDYCNSLSRFVFLMESAFFPKADPAPEARKASDSAPEATLAARGQGALAFGKREAVECRSLLEFAQNTRQAVPSLIDYDAKSGTEFQSYSSMVRINETRLFAANMPEVRTQARVGGEASHTFGIHLAGECFFQVEKKTYAIRPKLSAVFLPDYCPWVVEALQPSTVVASIDKHRLESTAQVMLGEAFRSSVLPQLRHPIELALQFGPISFDWSFRNLFAQIDSLSADAAMLDASGLDDVLYRALVLSLTPDVFVRQSQSRRLRASVLQLDRVCDHITANLAKRITLTDLERIGHMSRRTLHNTFIAAFAMSPMAWVREQRLLAARAQLIQAKGEATIKQVMVQVGFHNGSVFAAQYFRRFGELPSQSYSNTL